MFQSIWKCLKLFTGITYFLSFHFIVPHRFCIFLQIEGLWRPCIEQVYWHHFSNSICYLPISVCHILVILPIFQTLLLFCLLWCSVMSDLWCYYCHCWGGGEHHKWHPHKTMSLTDKLCVLTPPPTGHSPIALPLLRSPYSLRCSNTKNRPINKPAVGLWMFKWKEGVLYLSL